VATGDAGDDDVEERDNAVDDGCEDGANAIDDCHQYGADGPANGLNAGDDGTHDDWLCSVLVVEREDGLLIIEVA